MTCWSKSTCKLIIQERSDKCKKIHENVFLEKDIYNNKNVNINKIEKGERNL